jgi:cycloeucalenol cycloisomerase
MRLKPIPSSPYYTLYQLPHRYTHYFYNVLQARYTFPAHRLNDVPIALYFATHFYFVTYHTFSNLMLRKIETRYAPGWKRTTFFWMTVLAFSYFTAFMETLTISSFPYYSFADKEMAYRLGSAFYGLYFIVSFPLFYRIDEHASCKTKVLPYDIHQVEYTIYSIVYIV